MSTRKTVGWLVFAALAVGLLSRAPRVAGIACYFVGARFYAVGNYEAASGAYRGAVQIDPSFARGYVELGSAYLALKKYALAEEAFLKAKSIEDESCASCGLGMTYHALGRNDAAEKEFNRAISLNPDDACAYEQSARMYYDLGNYKQAIATLKHAVILKPRFGNYMYLGNAHVFAREFEAGVDAYKKAIKLKPKDVNAHDQLGLAYYYLDRYELAIEEYQQAIKLDPNDETARYWLALAYLAMHNKPAALEQYEILRKISPDTAAELVDVSGLSEKREKGKEKLYFIPLNDFSKTSLNELVTFCKEKKGIDATVTQPVPLALSAIDRQRWQVIAEEAVELMKRRYPDLAADPNAILIGLTDADIYIRNKSWDWAFSYRTEGRFAVVSSARMNPVNHGASADAVLMESRIRKMVLKNIGILYYRLPTNYDPKSVLYGEVEGVEGLDNMGDDF